MRIRDLQKEVSEFSKLKGFESSSIENRVLYLITEIGEITKEVLKLEKPHYDHTKIKEEIGLEIYDAVWNLVDLANKLDIDLEDAFQKKMKINKSREW